MNPIDLSIFFTYMIAMILVGLWFWKKNHTVDDYFIGGRKMGSFHVGLSIVATDVGGGFSIGLGGLGFTMGISGSWLLFTGLIGALLCATLLVPHLRANPKFANASTFPDLLNVHFGKKAAMIAAVISAIGYLGFTSSQLLAGAKLAGAAFPQYDSANILILIGIVAVAYTVLGGLKAVIFTDSIQWTVLLLGLSLVGIPVCLHAVGGFSEVLKTLPDAMWFIGNITWQKALYWTVTIIPIWFVAMTLYQRIYACSDEKTAKRAFYIAGLFEWPIMAFIGVFLGMLAKTALMKGLLTTETPSIDAELGLPLMLTQLLPVGAMGILMSAYFSAILSTADSCLMAASGNTTSDILSRIFNISDKKMLSLSQLITLILGVIAILLASTITSVLTLMLHSYAFMVSGLFIPVLACLFFKRKHQAAAIGAMLVGGSTTLLLTLIELPLPLNLDPNIFGITASLLTYLFISGVASKTNR